MVLCLPFANDTLCTKILTRDAGLGREDIYGCFLIAPTVYARGSRQCLSSKTYLVLST